MLSTAICAFVLAQNALDGNLQRSSGTALDRSLQQGKTVNAATSRQDYRSRNLVVTGDVAGGRGFRGSVGYTAAEDFRGATSDDTTRRFRAAASVSSADALSSISMNDRFSVATGMGVTAYRRDFGGRDLTSAVQADSSRIGWDSGLVSARSPTSENFSRMQLDMLTRQSSSGAELYSLYQPATVTVTGGVDQRAMRLIASPFNGVVAIPNNDLIESLSQGIYASSLMRSDLRSGRADGQRMLRSYLSGVIPDPSAPKPTEAVTGLMVDGRALGSAPGSPPADGKNPNVRWVGEMRTPYDHVIASVTSRFREAHGEPASEPGALVDFDSMTEVGKVLKEFRDGFQLSPSTPVDETARLLGTRDSNATATKAPLDSAPAANSQVVPAPQAAGTSTADGITGKSGGNSGAAREELNRDGSVKKVRRNLTGDEAYLLLAHGNTIAHLDGGTKEALDTMLQAGDQAMRSKRFFTAEKAFTTGALIAPSNPLPVAGLANSQIAARLQIAGAITLRRLFMTWPEMIDTKYAHEILGSLERIRTVGEDSLARSVGSKYESDYGLVAAYVGHQIGDDAMTGQGLAIMERDPADRAFTAALRAIWLNTGAEPAPAADAPAPVAPPTGVVPPSN